MFFKVKRRLVSAISALVLGHSRARQELWAANGMGRLVATVVSNHRDDPNVIQLNIRAIVLFSDLAKENQEDAYA